MGRGRGGGVGGRLGSSGGGMSDVGRPDNNTVEGVGGGLDFVDGLPVVGLEADLSLSLCL